MFWSSSKSTVSPRRARLSLESLDLRLLPDATPATLAPPLTVYVQFTATTDVATTTDPSTTAQTGTDSSTLVTASEATATTTATTPEIVEFGASEIGTGWYVFSGRIVANNPEGIVVSLGGGPGSVQGVTATVQEDGTFSVLVQMQTDGSDQGTVTAVFTENGVQSNVATVLVSP